MNLNLIVNDESSKTAKPKTEPIQNMNFSTTNNSSDVPRLMQSTATSNSSTVNWTNQKSPFAQTFSPHNTAQSYFSSQRQITPDSYKYSQSNDVISNASAYAQRNENSFLQRVYFPLIWKNKNKELITYTG